MHQKLVYDTLHTWHLKRSPRWGVIQPVVASASLGTNSISDSNSGKPELRGSAS